MLVPVSGVERSSDAGAWAVLTLFGEVDLEVVPRVREAVDELVSAGRVDLVWDLSRVSFMDSAGLGILVYTMRAVEAAQGGVRLAAAPAQVLRLLTLTGLGAELASGAAAAFGTMPRVERFLDEGTPAVPLAGEVLMSTLFDAAGAGVYAVDAHGTVVACNPWAEQLLGYEPGTLIGVDAHRTLNPQAANLAGLPGQRPILTDVAQGKRISGDRAVLLRTDGTALPVWWSAVPLPPEAGHGIGAVVVFHDASAQRERAERRAPGGPLRAQ